MHPHSLHRRCLGLIILGCAILGGHAALASDRPNILWLVSEDNNPYLGCYRDPVARTPVLDQLARDGVRYTNVHSPAPVCAPTRASLIEGRYAPGVGTQHMRSRIPLPEDLRYFPSFLRAAGYYCTNNNKTDYNAAILPDTWDENSNRAHWRNRHPGQPFFAVFNFSTTHESSLHRRLKLTTDPAAVRVPSYLPDTAETRADLAQYYDRMAVLDGQIRAALAELETAGLLEDTIIFYYADNGGVLPRSKRYLYDNGTHVPLIIRFPRKWPQLAPAASGSILDEMVSFVDFPPTLLSLAGITPPRQFEGRALAGPDRQPGPPYVYAFRDRMDETYDLGRVVIGPRYRYIRNYRPDLPAGQHVDFLWRMASMATWDELHRAGRLTAVQEAFFRPRPPEELYDTVADPDNVRNLAEDPACEVILHDMRAANRAHLLATRDLGFMPEPMIRARAGDQSPAVLGRDEQAYPLESLLDLIDRLQLPAHPPGPALAAALRSPQTVVRYWACVAALRADGLPEGVEELMADTDASVRLAAATVVLRRGDDTRAWGAVAASLAPDRSPEEVLTALNVVAAQPACPESVRAAVAAIRPPDEAPFNTYLARLPAWLLAGRPVHFPP